MKGIYLLGINIEKNIVALGEITFVRGYYVYVGSAQNSLNKRIQRHLAKDKCLRWHIDYLLEKESAKLVRVYYKNACKDFECKIANELAKMGESIHSFGSSDCKCRSHLFKIRNDFDAKSLDFENYVI